MQSVSDDDVRKRLLEKPRFELAVKGVLRLGRCYIFWQGVPGLQVYCVEIVAHCDYLFELQLMKFSYLLSYSRQNVHK